jgi:hypothetical protein
MIALRTKLMLAGTIAALCAGLLGPVGVAQARHGSDDPVAHNAGDDHGGLRARAGDDRRSRRPHARAARHGRDDRPGDDHGSR